MKLVILFDMDMFVWPLAFFLIVVPILVRLFWSPNKGVENTVSVAIRVPFFERISGFQTLNTQVVSQTVGFLLTLSWVCFVVACMRPIAFLDTAPIDRLARNIMLVVDTSGSMSQEDFLIDEQPVSRLEIVKRVVDDFIKNRTEDNVGLVIFGSEAYTYAPLSFDKQTLRSLFSEVNTGIAGETTAIGDALTLAVQDVSSVPNDSKIIVLLSDGYDNASTVSVDKALEIAKKQDVKVYTVGVGSDVQLANTFMGLVPVNPSADLDEKTLKKIAKQTGGKYFRAKSTQELQEIYQDINALERVKAEDITARPRTELFYIPLMGCLLFLLAAFVEKRRQS